MIKYVDISKNLLKTVFEDSKSDSKKIYIFPTPTSKKAFQIYYQNMSEDFNSDFITLSDFLQQLFIIDKVILREEKRIIQFHFSLSEKNKKFFKINDYFDTIDFAHNFFQFFEELNEELVDFVAVEKVIEDSFAKDDWKKKTFEHLLSIRQEYYDYISSNNFTDKIFLQSKENLSLQHLNIYKQIIIFNQFYFTNLEKHIFDKLSKLSEVILYSQQPQNIFDNNFENIAEIKAEDIKNALINKRIYHLKNIDSEQMIFSALKTAKQNSIRNFIDFKFSSQPYHNFLSDNLVLKSKKVKLYKTSFYRFLQHLHAIFAGIKIIDQKEIVPLGEVITAFFDDSFCRYFADGNLIKLRKFLLKLSDNDYKYFDLELTFYPEEKIPQMLFEFCDYLKSLLSVNSITKLAEEIFSGKLSAERISDSFEKQYGLEEIYRATNDFQSLEKIIKNKYNLLFNKKNSFEFTEKLLFLYLSYLKPKSFGYEVEKSTSEKIRFTTLQKSRNSSFHDLIILNVNENILPAAQQSQFLLSDLERKKLGLKTYDSIKSRDKYYFYRLLCQSEKTYLFSIDNEGDNIETSSFIEELKIANLLESSSESDEFNKGTYLQNIFSEEALVNVPTIEPSFFTIPFSKKDFADKKIKLSPTAWENLQNPFEFYLKYNLDIKPQKIMIDEDYSSRFVGNFAHNVINGMWTFYQKRYNFNIPPDFYKTAQTNFEIKKNIQRFLNSNEFIYKIPHNYSDIYFKNIFLPLMTEGIKNFFSNLCKRIQLVNFEPVPEKKYLSEKERLGRKIFSYHDFDVIIYGKADLRLETPTKKIIIDYKTGKPNSAKNKKYARQLSFYELIYYLFTKVDFAVESTIYFIEHRTMAKPKQNLSDELIEEIKDSIARLFDYGFMVSAKKVNYEDEDITRRDLMGVSQNVNK